MSKNDNILQNYFAALNEQIDSVSYFNDQTEAFLASDKLVNLLCEDLGLQAFKGIFGSGNPTNVEKLLVLIRELAIDSKSYLDRLSTYAPVLGKLITFIIKGASN